MTDLAVFRGRWALVTGAGDGIGRALALSFARAGLNVVACDIRADAAQAVAGEAGAVGVAARALVADVSDRAALMVAAEALAADGVTPSLLFINAGVGAGIGVVDASPKAIEWMVGVNILGVAWTAQAFVPRMLEADGPKHVGVTASSASLVDVRGPFPFYAASKQGAAGVAEALAAELTLKGVGVTILYPGLLNTNIWDAARARPDRFGGARSMPDHVGETWRAAPGPEVVVDPVLATIAAGGGRCVVDVSGEARRLFAERTQAIEAAFAAPWNARA